VEGKCQITNSYLKCSIKAIELKQRMGAQPFGGHVRARLHKSESGRAERKEQIFIRWKVTAQTAGPVHKIRANTHVSISEADASALRSRS
jgi:hypothetical protein